MLQTLTPHSFTRAVLVLKGTVEGLNAVLSSRRAVTSL